MTDLFPIASALLKRAIQPSDSATVNLKIETIATAFRGAGVRRLVVVQITPTVQLAWSGRGDTWRFVTRERVGVAGGGTHLVEHQVVSLLDTSLEERLEAFSSGAMEALVRQTIGSADSAL